MSRIENNQRAKIAPGFFILTLAALPILTVASQCFTNNQNTCSNSPHTLALPDACKNFSLEKRNDRLEKLVKQAQKIDRQQQITLFRAGGSHADSRKWGNNTAKLMHNSVRMGGGR